MQAKCAFEFSRPFISANNAANSNSLQIQNKSHWLGSTLRPQCMLEVCYTIPNLYTNKAELAPKLGTMAWETLHVRLPPRTHCLLFVLQGPSCNLRLLSVRLCAVIVENFLGFQSGSLVLGRVYPAHKLVVQTSLSLQVVCKT